MEGTSLTSTQSLHLPSAISNVLSPPPKIVPFRNPGDRPLVTYVYAESDHARQNFLFFIKHALHDKADFVFIFNGPSTGFDKNGPTVDVETLLPNRTVAPHIRVVRRSNDCYDLGAHGEVLTSHLRHDDGAIDDGEVLWKRYKKFIVMNASVRGPFFPTWSSDCWTDKFLNKLTDKVKLVGLSLNCWPTIHVQSMLWGLDSVGMSLLLYPPKPTPNHDKWAAELPQPPDTPLIPITEEQKADNRTVREGINRCFHNYETAVEAEVGATPIIKANGYEIDNMLTKFKAGGYDGCEGHARTDAMVGKEYDGADVHPYETIFIKTNRNIDPILLDNISKWTNQINYNSSDFC